MEDGATSNQSNKTEVVQDGYRELDKPNRELAFRLILLLIAKHSDHISNGVELLRG